jgi:hypothetical protein
VRQEVCSNKMCVTLAKAPCELSTQSQVEAKRQPSLGGDGCAVGGAEIVINALPALWDQLARDTQRSEPVSIRKRSLLDLSVTKGRLVAVVQTCATTDVFRVSFPCSLL